MLVLEARSEVGGRTRSRAVGGVVADFGGEWIGWAHRRAHGLVRELGLTAEPARNAGYPVLWRLPSGELVGRLPPASSWSGLARVVGKAAWLARGIRTTAPWEAKRARELDAISIAEWLDRLGVAGNARYILERLIGSLSSRELERLSLLHFLWWMRLAGGSLRSLHTSFQSRLSEGAQEISRRIARELGDSVRVNAPVRRVAQAGDEVAVEVEGGESCEGRRAIIAVPVPYVERIDLDPPLPERQRELAAMNIGAATKVIAILPRGHGVRHNTVIGGEALWSAWRHGDRVTGFAPPPSDLLPAEALVADLARAFRVAPGDLRSVTVFRWAEEEYIPGCDVAFAPGEVCRYGPALARPYGRLHFAGAERSSWPNNMEGALESGERAAREVIEGYRQPHASRRTSV